MTKSRRLYLDLIVAIAVILLFIPFLFSLSDKPRVQVENPPGENATASTAPTTTSTTTTAPPNIKFVTTSQGTNEFGKFIWHGTIDGIECLIYADKMFCKGMTEVANGVTPP